MGNPTMEISLDLTAMTDYAIHQLQHLVDPYGSPLIYQRARRLSLIAHGVTARQWMHRPPEAPVIIEASPAALYEHLTQSTDWTKYDARKKKWLPAGPPARIVPTIQGRPSWDFPALEGIIHTPTLRPDGSLVEHPGYDSSTGLYLDTNGQIFPPLPEHPDKFDAIKAVGILKEPLKEFVWQNPYDLIAAVSAICTMVCRYTILGNVPLFSISATTRGSGKGLLADIIALVGTGRRAPLWAQADDDAEERKRLLALGLDGDPLVCLDNVTRPLGSGPLDLALTSSVFKDRLLGTQKALEVPMHAVFLATGNNIQYLGDLARRVVPIALDPKMERPEERSGFKYPDLRAYVLEHRPTLVAAALTIIKAYFTAALPHQSLTTYGSFEQWSDIIRSALVWTGEPDPCEGRKTIEAQDPGHEALADLLRTWDLCYPLGAPVTLKQLRYDVGFMKDGKLGNQWDDLESAITGFCDQHAKAGTGIDTRKLGNALKRVQGRVINGRRLIKAGEDDRAIKWSIQTIGPSKAVE